MMKTKSLLIILTLIFAIGLTVNVRSQNVAISNDGSDPDPSAMLDIKAAAMGLLIPRITEANRPANPATGLLIYQTDNEPGFYYFDGAAWQKIENVEQLEAVIQVEATARENGDSGLQDELDATQTGAGLGTGGSYTANGTANYISEATTLQDADNKLDAQIKSNANTLESFGSMATQDADDVSISGGTIDGTEIGTTGAQTGKFTTIETTGIATIGDDLTVNGVVTLPLGAGDNKVLTSDGDGNASWQEVNGLPDQSGNAGKVLTTDGTDASWQSNDNLNLDPAPAVNSASGITSSVLVDENTLGFAAALFVAPDGNYELANATDISTMPCVALAIETGTGTKKILHQGYVRNDDWNWTVGGIIYVSTTDGVLSQEFPTETANQVQIVGYATATNKIFFSPNFMLIELN
ncbi:MAG: hypothetical protein K9H16_08575 [Bacteroidales bacterium]|nr:hypothetical protein [Bacteroidales bacterium]